MVAVFAHRSPTGKQRPNRSEVIAARVVMRISRRNNSHAPVSLVVVVSQLVNHGFSLVALQQVEPHRDGCQQAAGVKPLTVLVERVGEQLFLRRPEDLIQRRMLALEGLREILADIIFANYAGQARKRAQSFGSQANLVKLLLDGKQRAAFDPTVPNADILRQALLVQG